jgi:hypothetical protein
MSNVHSLSGRPISIDVNQELVERLEDLLVRARNGEIVSIIYAAARRDDVAMTGWTLTPDGVSLSRGLVALNYQYGKAASGE